MNGGTSSSEFLEVPRSASEGRNRGAPRSPEALRGTVLLLALFFLLRLLLLVVREPFFDELFTVWMAGKPFGSILPALQLDSGPPLYYLIARIPDVIALRVLSLVFATVAFVLVLRRSLVAAALLAVYPPAVLFAVEGRSYALCALFIAVAVLHYEEKPWVTAFAVLLAAYTHWYGALFFPLLLFGRGPRLKVWVTTAVLFVPGLLLAMRQPPASMAWVGERQTLDALWALSFVRTYPASLFGSVPWSFIIGAAGATVLTFLGVVFRPDVIPAGERGTGLGGDAHRRSLAPWVLIPLVLAIVFSLFLRPVYFAMRFESVIAVPLVLWLAQSLERWPRRLAISLGASLGFFGLAAVLYGAIDHARRPLEPLREAAAVLRTNVRPGERVLATGYLYLEAVHQLGDERVRAYPAEQGRHPGWRVSGTTEALPAGSFVWIVERGAPELAAFGRERRPVRVLFRNQQALILRVE